MEDPLSFITLHLQIEPIQSSVDILILVYCHRS